MRHRVFGKKLNRDIKERKALFKALIESLILQGKVKTTLAKGKAIKGLVDKLVNLARKRTSSALIQLQSFLVKKKISEKLIKEIAPKFPQKTSGFTTLRRVGERKGDGAEEIIIEWSKDKTYEEKKEEKENKEEKQEKKLKNKKKKQNE